ncbi:MAG: hypothetical protein PF590_09650 [Candidatus Delongbacteria bacterium]|jgi:hypothetical protein|nr:hypothetical protein [Candidatus Delongbacteria bacterium]
MDTHFNFIGILVRDPELDTTHLQDTLTSYGCNIRTRLGLNSTGNKKNPLILLDLYGDEQEQNNLMSALKAIPGIEVKNMIFQG